MGFSLPIGTDGLGGPASQFQIIIDTNLLFWTRKRLQKALSTFKLAARKTQLGMNKRRIRLWMGYNYDTSLLGVKLGLGFPHGTPTFTTGWPLRLPHARATACWKPSTPCRRIKPTMGSLYYPILAWMRCLQHLKCTTHNQKICYGCNHFTIACWITYKLKTLVTITITSHLLQIWSIWAGFSGDIAPSVTELHLYMLDFPTTINSKISPWVQIAFKIAFKPL